ncbi:MotB family protein [Afifella pfennigii]|uniref:MotB family protein n=1 Tax=Afifella pfennigii TaxID=209897 RepID=UPI00047B617C|nr:MotB family protein [Afifella pfennigii]
MADQEHPELIIVRRYEEEEHETHSSAWKVAHADFMTAMMAFFLIMWLINVTDDQMKKSIADYFNPVRLSASVTEEKGLVDEEKVRNDGSDPIGKVEPTEGPESESQLQVEGGTQTVTEAGGTSERSTPAIKGGFDASDAAAERAAFSDPYAVLAKLAAEVKPLSQSAVPDTPIGEVGEPGVPGHEAYRDPFDPIYWQMTATDSARTTDPSPRDRAETVPDRGLPDAIARRPFTEGEAREMASPSASASGAGEDGEVTSEEIAKANAIEEALDAALKESLAGAELPNVEVKATSEGILISLTDEMDYSMFEIGSAIPKPAVVVAMEEVAEVLAGWPGNIVVRGFTDGRPFRSETYDNWRLSTARAHMAYYMLTRGSLPDQRIRKIEGFADRNLKNPADPNAAENRRIEILLQEHEA